MGGGISLTLFNELQLFGWVNCKEGDNKFQPGPPTVTMTDNSLIRVNVIEFGDVRDRPMTIVNPTGRDVIMDCFGQATYIDAGSESSGSGRHETYYNSFSSTGTWLIGNAFYLKPGQTITCQSNTRSRYPVAYYITPK